MNYNFNISNSVPNLSRLMDRGNTFGRVPLPLDDNNCGYDYDGQPIRCLDGNGDINTGGGGVITGGGGNFTPPVVPTIPPNFAIGGFTGTSNTGVFINLVIDAVGNVTAAVNGTLYNGVYSNGYLVLNGDSSTLTQTAIGLDTTRVDTGEVIHYQKVSGNNNNGGDIKNPPILPVCNCLYGTVVINADGTCGCTNNNNNGGGVIINTGGTGNNNNTGSKGGGSGTTVNNNSGGTVSNSLPFGIVTVTQNNDPSAPIDVIATAQANPLVTAAVVTVLAFLFLRKK